MSRAPGQPGPDPGLDPRLDRLIDVLLDEQVGGRPPPDVSARVLAAAFPPARRPTVGPWRFLRRNGWLLGAAAAAGVLMAVGLWTFRPAGPPGLAVAGRYRVVSGDSPTDGAVARGSTLRAESGGAVVELAEGIRVQVRPDAVVRIDGRPGAESIWLETGEVRCTVRPGAAGGFAVRTAVGTVKVVGTEFEVRLADDPAPGVGGAATGGNAMGSRQMFVKVLAGAVIAAGAWGEVRIGAGEERPLPPKKEVGEKAEKRAGVIVGTLTAKGPNWIEVKADGEEKARRYVPHWRGGLPKDGGGPDKAMVRVINGLTVGSQLRVGWEFEERPRVVKVEVLEKAAPGDGDREEPRREGRDEPKRPAKGEGGAREGGPREGGPREGGAAGGEEGRHGQSVGTIAAKGSNWIDLKGDGDAKPRRYYFLIGRVSRELQQAHRELPVGTRVRVEWTFVETWRMLALQKLGE
mgnify:CR=1 FL=1